MAYRSAKTGKYISKAAAARWPGRSVRESSKPSSGSGRTVHRSAVTGQACHRIDGEKAAKPYVN